MDELQMKCEICKQKVKELHFDKKGRRVCIEHR
jgi:hypothetical protein